MSPLLEQIARDPNLLTLAVFGGTLLGLGLFAGRSRATSAACAGASTA